jgi:hypothetical protein
MNFSKLKVVLELCMYFFVKFLGFKVNTVFHNTLHI